MTTPNSKRSELNPVAQVSVRRAVQTAGFTLVELCVVMAISVILAAIAVPEVLNTYYASRVRDAANELSALVQQARILAQQSNATVPVYAGTVSSGAKGAFIACASIPCPSGGNGSSYQTADRYLVSYASNVDNGSSVSAPAGLNPGFLPAAGTLYFSPRGVTVSGPGGNLVNGFVFYLTDGNNHWAAVAVSSIGRSKVYVWNGSNWN
jgi:prepilin-type N-terminal cleavage/methylation domain-containing protein